MEGDCSIERSDEGQIQMSTYIDINAVIEAPKVGMEFDTYDALANYYARYALQAGFAICKRSSTKGKDGKMRYGLLECYKGGKPRSRGANIVKPRPQSKLQCPARIRSFLSADDKWKVNFVCLDHNHEQSPEKARRLNGNRKIDEETKRKLEFHDLAGIKLNKTFDLIQIESGGAENLPFSQKNCQNYLSKFRRLQLVEGDAEAMNSYFKKMKADNDEFFYALDLNEEGRLRNVFWADARSRAACKEFGDVVTFDTTYLVNRYDIPFAPFVSVNHHGNSVLLGCGLVSHEDTESFIWLFDTWLTCMKGCAPKAIITDQCMAMKNAIEYVFPASRHRWCIWHIMKKLPDKLNGCKEYESIKNCMKQAVYDSLTIEEFEDAWSAFITKYDLHGNKWLTSLYVEKARWVPAFVKDMFWAGMSSTQRSEGINAYFDGYINARTTLKQFVEQYEVALAKKVEIEKEEDVTSWKSFIPCINTDNEWEPQFQSVYTNNKVREFQREITRMFKCQIWARSGTQYEIKEWIFFGEEVRHKKRVLFKVLINEDTNETQCNCRLFEFKGMVCAHQMMVWNDKGIQRVPNMYVFKRWCKNVKRAHSKVRIGYDKSSKGIELRRRENMYNVFKDVVENAEESSEKYEKVMVKLHDLKQEFDEALGVCKSIVVYDTPHHDVDSCSFHDVLAPSKQCTSILDPEPVRGQGKTPFKRKEGLREKFVKAKKRKEKNVGITKKMNKRLPSSENDEAVGKTKKMKKMLPSNENDEGHLQTISRTHDSLSTFTDCYTASSQNYVPCLSSYDPSSLSLTPVVQNNQVPRVWNFPQSNPLDDYLQTQEWKVSISQVGVNGSQWSRTMFESNSFSQPECRN